jgi:glycerophosphoryl diester phosphodiesterase
MKKSYFVSGILITIILFSCKTNKPQGKPFINPLDYTYDTMQNKLDKHGHRGARGLMPENTWPAMKLALDLGVTTLEMDAVITKDKKVILSHEPFMSHEITTKPDGSYVTEAEEKSLNIYQMTYDEVKKYDVGMKPHPRFPKQQKINAVKPLLSDLFDSVRQYMMTRRRPFPYYNIETKCMPATDDIYHPKPDEFTELLMAVIKEKHMEEQVIIQSFDFRSLQYLHQKYPAVKTAMLIEDFDKRTLEDQLKDFGFIPSIYSPHYSLVTDELIKKCHLQNIKIIPWTVNDKAAIDKLIAIGVDGIITDYPDLFNE